MKKNFNKILAFALTLIFMVSFCIPSAKAIVTRTKYEYEMIYVKLLYPHHTLTDNEWSQVRDAIYMARLYWAIQFNVPMSVFCNSKTTFEETPESFVNWYKYVNTEKYKIYVVDGEYHTTTTIAWWSFTDSFFSFSGGAMTNSFSNPTVALFTQIRANTPGRGVHIPIDSIRSLATRALGVQLGLGACWYAHDMCGIPCVMGSTDSEGDVIPTHLSLCQGCKDWFINNICRPNGWMN